MRKAFYLLVCLIFATMIAKSSERLELLRCKVVYLTSFPKNNWPYNYSFISDWECDTLETDLSSLSTFSDDIKHTTTELGELSINLYQPYIHYSLISDILPLEDSLSLYISDCQNKINDNSFEYTVVTHDSTTINCAITDVLGIFFVDSNRMDCDDERNRVVLVSLITCSPGSKIDFINKNKSLPAGSSRKKKQ